MLLREAYLRQAASDLKVYEALRSPQHPQCHALHYLQMATEKLGKAVLLSAGAPMDAIQRTHVAFSRLPTTVRKRRDVSIALGYPRYEAYCAFLDSIAGLARQIDELHPQAGPSANCEYPWFGRGPGGEETWQVPATWGFALYSELSQPHGAALIRFLRQLIDRFDAVFP